VEVNHLQAAHLHLNLLVEQMLRVKVLEEQMKMKVNQATAMIMKNKM
jgi:hypothetical protein